MTRRALLRPGFRGTMNATEDEGRHNPIDSVERGDWGPSHERNEIMPQEDAFEPAAFPAAAGRRVGVIGAGLVGLSTAIWLQRAGHSVTLLDANDPLDKGSWRRAASFGNACTFATGACLPVAMPGTLRAVPGMLADPDGPLALRWSDLPALTPWLLAFLRSSSKREVDRIVSQLGRLIRAAGPAQESLMEEAGAGHLARRNGCLYLYKSEAGFEAARRDIDLRAREGVAMTVLSRDDVRDREPNLAPLYRKGLLFDEAWHLDTPYDYALALAELFRNRGGTFRAAAIAALEPQESGIRLAGDPAAASFDRVVIAAGAWSRRLARSVGDRVLLDTERGYHVLFPESGGLLNAPTCYPEHGFYLTPTGEGLRAAGTVELGGLDKPPRANRTRTIERVARTLLPGLGAAGGTWMGFRPSMPDSLPVIGASPRDGRVVHAYGHGHIGLTLAAITGRLAAELVSGIEPSLDLSALRPDRFG